MSVVIMHGTYVLVLKVTCFILGYLIVKIGAGLLRDGIAGEFKFSASLPGAKGDLVSASPGLLFLLVGGVLIGYALWVPKPAEFQSEETRTVANPERAPEVEYK